MFWIVASAWPGLARAAAWPALELLVRSSVPIDVMSVQDWIRRVEAGAGGE